MKTLALKTLSRLVIAVAALAAGCVAYEAPRRDFRLLQRDRDGVPDRADRDRDGDGVPDRQDRRPDNPRRY